MSLRLLSIAPEGIETPYFPHKRTVYKPLSIAPEGIETIRRRASRKSRQSFQSHLRVLKQVNDVVRKYGGWLSIAPEGIETISKLLSIEILDTFQSHLRVLKQSNTGLLFTSVCSFQSHLRVFKLNNGCIARHLFGPFNRT